MRAENRVMADALVTACQTRDRALADLAIAEDALESERQWRLTSLPALLAAEARAVKAEARSAEVSAAALRVSGGTYPGFSDPATVNFNRALAAAYHAETERP